MSLICRIFGHSWRYNFVTVPSKRICARCGKREGLNLRTLNWTETFDDDRSDKELVREWSRIGEVL